MFKAVCIDLVPVRPSPEPTTFKAMLSPNLFIAGTLVLNVDAVNAARLAWRALRQVDRKTRTRLLEEKGRLDAQKAHAADVTLRLDGGDESLHIFRLGELNGIERAVS